MIAGKIAQAAFLVAGALYAAPPAPGTYTVVATSVADPAKKDSATVTVTPPGIFVSLAPPMAIVPLGGKHAFSATVTGTTRGQSSAVTWSVEEGAAGGSVDANGNYTAPAAEGVFHVVATSAADASRSARANAIATSLTALTADRRTLWTPGLNAVGGIPNRSTICATVEASSYGNGAQDATDGIQAAIDACPPGQVVQLSAGTFTINGGQIVYLNKGVTLRGAGPQLTKLQKTDGAKPGREAAGPHPSPLIIIGPARWGQPGGSSTNLTSDAVKGAYSVTVASASAFRAGQIVLLDELSGAAWQADPRGQVWASPDGRVTWQLHNPARPTDDPLKPTTPTSGDAAGWFCRQDRPTNEIKKIIAVSGNTVTFDTPVHISYRTSHTAQLSTFWIAHTRNAGVEDLSVVGGDNGQIRFLWAAESWAKNIDNTTWHDEGFAVDYSFRVEIRDSYVHDAAWAQPGGAGYAISLANGSSEVLIENCIVVRANKLMVARSSGTASVFGYNYVDQGYINTNGGWIEVGLNASHMAGPHHVLFEGNYAFNWDSDKTHGSSIYHTVFRNHLRGIRARFTNQLNGKPIDDTQGNGPARCIGTGYYSYWMTFIGNVLGAAGKMSGWANETSFPIAGAGGIWMLGWDDWPPYLTDQRVKATAVRHGNFDYLSNGVVWDPSNPDHRLPRSLYLSKKPAFFNAGTGYTWPWVDPGGSTKLYTLPAKARFDAGTPFTQP